MPWCAGIDEVLPLCRQRRCCRPRSCWWLIVRGYQVLGPRHQLVVAAVSVAHTRDGDDEPVPQPTQPGATDSAPPTIGSSRLCVLCWWAGPVAGMLRFYTCAGRGVANHLQLLVA
jgi:hypothetical protein